MKNRCYRPNTIYYHRYGGRGIKVCDRWMEYSNFESDLIDSYERHLKIHGSLGTTLDRINNNGDYSPENCKWSTPKEQCQNRKPPREIRVTIGGESKNLKEWSEIYKTKYSTVRGRIYLLGWEPVRAITTPARKWGQNS